MKKAIRFSIVVCILSWILYTIAMGPFHDFVMSRRLYVVLLEVAFMAVPLLSVFVSQWMSKDYSAFRLLRFNPSMEWLTGILLMVIAIIMVIPISVLFPGIEFNYGPEQLMALKNIDEEVAGHIRQHLDSMPPYSIIGGALIRGLLGGLTISALFSLGEEFVWRAYLLDLLKGHKFWTVALYVGFVNGIWHAPMILFGHIYHQHPIAGVFMMSVLCILTGCLIMYFVIKTGSVVLGAAMHGVINGLVGIVYLLTLGGSDLTAGFTGFAGFITLGILIAVLYYYDTKVSKDRIMSSNVEIR